MKTFTKKSVTQKIVIVLITVIMLSFSIPKPVHADWGGILISPLISLATSLVDGAEYLLEWMMLGKTNYFMDKTMDEYVSNDSKSSDSTITVDSKVDGSFLGLDKPNIPDIQYTPEAIFSNRVPALDINFIKPSVTTGNNETDQKMNVAIKLRPVIASWYKAIRTLAIVGLLSVLIYLGIRMLLTSVAADRAKYKKMIIDWIVAMCLVFALHYIMSLALTASEVVTSMISSGLGKTVTVEVATQNNYKFNATLMNYVRFMIQSTDFKEKVVFFFLYLMLVIYTFRFTWTYLKRVVNMAFLTLIAPVVALTYPIDKVNDGSAQAFNMWVREFTFNALLQPLHLFIYTVLLGASVELAVNNPLYAIVCLAFIFAAEKLVKQMFGFSKANGGTVGSLAGAMGVSALANKALMSMGKGPNGGKGGNGKVRTNDKYKREGKDQNANKGYKAFDKEDNKGIDTLAIGDGQQGEGTDDKLPPPANDNNPKFGKEQEDEMSQLQEYFDNTDNNEAFENPEEYQAKLDRMKELEEAKRISENQNTQPTEQQEEDDDEPQPVGSPSVQNAVRQLGSESSPETISDLWNQDRAKMKEGFANKVNSVKTFGSNVKNTIGTKEGRKELTRKAGVGAYKTIRGVAKAMPTVAYKGVKTAGRVGVAAALGATAGVIGATTGDGDKALSWAAAAAGVGFATGDNLVDATLGKAMQNTSVRDAYGAGKEGSAIDARNKKADKEYLKSQEHKEEYEKYFKDKMTKAEFNKATREYREVGITDKKDIRNALKLEEKYREEGKDGKDPAKIRGKVQNIVQSYDAISKKAIYGEDKNATEAALKNIEGQLTTGDAKQKRAIANEILQGYKDWYNIG